jgi:hypothetical protein
LNVSVSHIFDLVKSLSPSEKGYIKKYFNSSSKILISFNSLIDYVDSFPTASALESDKNANFSKLVILAEDFFSALLSALEKYHSSPQKEIRKHLNIIEIVVEKNLYAQAEKLIAKAKSLAEKTNDYHLYAELSDWEIALLGQKPPTEKLLKEFGHIFEKLVHNINKDPLIDTNA